MHTNRALSRGFTLLELLVVMVTIGLLASHVAPRFFDQIGKSEIKTTHAQLDAGRYLTTEQGIGALVERATDETKWSGLSLAKALPLDPWPHAYAHWQPCDAASHDFELLIYGKAGQAGSAGENADISVWEIGS
ncbi:type II secretion system protein GspG [Roseateles sp. BYS78W]|uniref:Type II secretion system protein GspG n=1 Tax=Pelomonas candidula TaxID=3299025 RepID=A0ABW7HI86_9BURK